MYAIAILSCRSPFLDDNKVYCPLASLYLKSYLEATVPGVVVEIVDDGYDLNELEFFEQFDAVGISVMTPQRDEAVVLAKALRRRFPFIELIVGGPHVKHYSQELLELGLFNYIVPLDGERALASIVSRTVRGPIVSDVLSRQEISAQPRPDRTSENARDVLARYRYTLAGLPATTMMTARGCPEQCTFCEEAMTQVRWTSIENIRGELSDIKALGYGGVYLFDDLFALSTKTIRPICNELHRFDFRYRCNAQARYFTRDGDEMARLLAETGCYEIAFGAESGSQTILDNVRKRCTVAQNYQTVSYAKKHNIVVKAFILLGLPGESWETLAETEAFIRDSGIDDFQCAVYMPFKGTQIRSQIDVGSNIDLRILPAGRDGDISGAYCTKGGNTSYEVRTHQLSADDLRVFRDELVRRYKPTSHRSKWQSEDKFFLQAAGCSA